MFDDHPILETILNHSAARDKSKNELNWCLDRKFVPLSPAGCCQRQSSITRLTSGQLGTYSVCMPVTSTAKRPRLNAIASSKRSRAGNITSTPAEGVVRASPVRLRVCAAAMMVTGTLPRAGPLRNMVIVPAARLQLRVSKPEPKRATDWLPSIRHCQSPGVIGACRQSIRGIGAGVGVGTGVGTGEGIGAGSTRRSEHDVVSARAVIKPVSRIGRERRFAFILPLWNETRTTTRP